MLAADCPSGRRPLSAGKHRKTRGRKLRLPARYTTGATSVRLTTVPVLVVDFAFVGVLNTSWSIFIFVFQVHPE